MGLLDQALSLGGDLVTGWVNNQYAEDRQADAQNFSAKQYATRYQTTVKDMQAAGLNPMLAYTQGVGNSPGGTVASSNATPSLGSSYNQSRQADAAIAQSQASLKVTNAQAANLDADTANKDAQREVYLADAAAKWASAGQSEANIKLINATVSRTLQEVTNLESENQKILAVVENLAAEREKLIKEGRNLDDVQSQLKATTAKLMAELPVLRSEAARNMASAFQATAAGEKSQHESALLKLDKAAAEKFDNLGRNMGQAKPVFDILNSILRAGKGK